LGPQKKKGGRTEQRKKKEDKLGKKPKRKGAYSRGRKNLRRKKEKNRWGQKLAQGKPEKRENGEKKGIKKKKKIIALTDGGEVVKGGEIKLSPQGHKGKRRDQRG